MGKQRSILILLGSLASASVVPLHFQCRDPPSSAASPKASNIPLILWHGLGDSFDSDGIQATGSLYREIYPHSKVYFVQIGDGGGSDRRSTFFGNATDQVKSICEDLRKSELRTAPAANLLGFSQGGQFARGLVQRCNVPPTRNLITFGAQHNGITSFARCDDGDWLCKAWDGTLRGQTWSEFAQSSLIPAQYYRDPEDLQSYLEHSNFLADANNERKSKNETYKKNLESLENFVMYAFEEEDVVRPKESSWFAEVNATAEKVTPLRERLIYKEDWLGLRDIDDRGGLLFLKTPGKHMQISEDALRKAFTDHMAPMRRGHASYERPQLKNIVKVLSAATSFKGQVVMGEDEESANEDPKDDEHQQHRSSKQHYIHAILRDFLRQYKQQYDPSDEPMTD